MLSWTSCCNRAELGWWSASSFQFSDIRSQKRRSSLQGENVKVVSERLGHASAALTLDTYSHVLPDMQQRTAEKVASLLFVG